VSSDGVDGISSQLEGRALVNAVDGEADRVHVSVERRAHLHRASGGCGGAGGEGGGLGGGGDGGGGDGGGGLGCSPGGRG
jgi:hypothetical protein